MTDGDSSFEAALAPHIDRLFVAGHRAARPYASEVRRGLDIPHFGGLIDLRKLLLSPRGVSVEEGHALERYTSRQSVESGLRQHLRQGLVQEEAGRYLPTERGRDVLLRLTDALIRGVTMLWIENEADVQTARQVTAQAVEYAAEVVQSWQYPAFNAERRGYMPAGAPPPFELWSRLATLRYLRADAHALAWKEAGLDATQIQVLTALWKEPAVVHADRLYSTVSISPELLLEAGEVLQARDWVTKHEDMLSISPEGRRARAAIEETTNRYNRPAYAGLTEDERVRLITSLERLRDGAASG